MDVSLYGRVIWRFRRILAVGFVLACILSVLAYGRPSLEGGPPWIEPRQDEIWSSTSLLLVSQSGFPIGRSGEGLYDVRKDPETGDTIVESRFADEERFAELAVVYAELAVSDAVQAQMRNYGRVDGYVRSTVVGAGTRDTLPLLRLTAYGSTPEAASALAEHHVTAFLDELDRQQREAAIPSETRVRVSVLARPAGAGLVADRGLTWPILTFISVMAAFLVISFVLENLRLRTRPSAPTIKLDVLDVVRERRSVR